MFMEPLRWPLEHNQMGVMVTSRNPKVFWPHVEIVEQIQIQFDVLVHLPLCKYARYS